MSFTRTEKDFTTLKNKQHEYSIRTKEKSIEEGRTK